MDVLVLAKATLRHTLRYAELVRMPNCAIVSFRGYGEWL